MNVVDSSGWLEYFGRGPNALVFAPVIRNTPELIVPTISLYEVFKRVHQQRNESEAFEAAMIMTHGIVVDLNMTIAVNAARLSASLKLPMADSIILATARIYGATLWTQDTDFKGIDGVQYVEKKP